MINMITKKIVTSGIIIMTKLFEEDVQKEDDEARERERISNLIATREQAHHEETLIHMTKRHLPPDD